MTRRKIHLLILAIIVSLAAYNLYPDKRLPENTRIDKLVVLKSERQLIAFSNGKKVKTYSIALGRNPKGDKQFEGDSRTPEGQYLISAKNPNSAYHKNLGISYPNAIDVRQAKKIGKPAGGDIKIHGLRNGTGFISKLHRLVDWTQGCIALTDEEMDELYIVVAIGTPILIKP